MQNKQIFILLLILILLPLYSQNLKEEVFEEAALKAYLELEQELPDSAAIFIKDFENDKDNSFKIALSKMILTEDKFQLSDKENLEMLFQEAIAQRDVAFEGNTAPKVGNFLPVSWVILGQIKYNKSFNWGKITHELKVDFTVDHIETGRIEIKTRLQTKRKSSISNFHFFFIIILFLALIYIINLLTKGIYINWLLLFSLIIVVGFTIWHFIL